jgi:hypothetical protein
VSHCCRGLGVQFAFQLAVDEQPAHSGADAAVFVPQRLAAAAAVEEQATVPVFPVPPDHRPLAPQVLLRFALLALLLLGYLRIQVAQVALHLHTPEGPGTTWRRATVDPVGTPRKRATRRQDVLVVALRPGDSTQLSGHVGWA